MDNLTKKISKSYTHFRSKICLVDNCDLKSNKLYKKAIEKNKLIEEKKRKLKDLYNDNKIPL